ncbi:46 kDa FK506-binding nuclear protein-like isoform X2 [Portunus trituberculatus]|uniref:46 kDa FK506-binding nuclear protein-like isoform X2 n=1 Tax=Portunus trituberculatus TaxID=210409 RepID=UPI001E1D025E|nr:46 kDa FK506-binding nuclear protein-like isoform X2 [Portunus trituberculatus]
MFWSLLLEPGKRYTKVVDSPFHISAAVLDTSTQDHGIVRVIVDIGDTEALIANLSYKHGILQFPLDLQFDSGSRISFYTTGAKSNVHLSGYVTYDEELFSEDDEGSSDEEVPTLVNVSAKRKPEESPSPGNKKAKLQKITPVTLNNQAVPAKVAPTKPEKKANAVVSKEPQTVPLEEDDEDGLDDSEEGEEEEDELEEEEDIDEEEEEDEDDMEEEEESDEDETEVMMIDEQKKTKKPNNIVAKKEAFPTKEPVAVFKTEKTPKGGKTPKDANTPKTPKIPGSNSGAPDKGKKTPNKPQGANAPTQNGKTPKSEIPAKEQAKSPQTPKMVKPGGVVCEDLVVGKGSEAKSGKMVSVYYVGRLMSNKKMFDKCDSGKGFKFRLGSGEVIKGWDVGVSGMKIGGKRKITCPPHMAYGKKGAPPDIPGNATLSFVVELKGIS